MEDKILEAVSEVTGISVLTLKSDDIRLETSRARMMYYYLCNEKGMLFEPVGKAVNRGASSVSKGVTSFTLFLRNNGRYRILVKEARDLVLGINAEDGKDWTVCNGHEYIYINGVKYSIHDISSRFFGNCFMGMINDEFSFACEDREQAIRKLTSIADK